MSSTLMSCPLYRTCTRVVVVGGYVCVCVCVCVCVFVITSEVDYRLLIGGGGQGGAALL